MHELPEDIVRPLHPYNPEFYDTPEDAPKDVGLSFPSSQFSSDTSRAFLQHRQNAYNRTPFGRGPQQRQMAVAPEPRQTSAAPAVRGRSLPLGTRVRHALLGEGLITGVSGSGGELQYVIMMDDGTEHHLIARYARLEALADA